MSGEEEQTVSKYFSQALTSTPKRGHPSTDSETDTSLISDKPLSKRPNMTEATGDPVQAALKELFDKMGTLATKEDIQLMKDHVKAFTGEVLEKLEKMEGQMVELESKTTAVAKEVKVVKGKTTRLEHNLNDHDVRIQKLEREMNDLEQYSRRSHLRVYKIPEAAKGQKEDVTKKVCSIFTDLVGVQTGPEDIEVAHRAGRLGDKPRPVLVRFFDRKKRDLILQNTRKLKGKNVVIDDDLTFLNYKLLRTAQSNTATMSVWSSNGKVLAKLKNGQTVRLTIHSDVDLVCAKAMNGQQDSSQDISSDK